MSKIEKLTPEQEGKLDTYRDMYLDKFFGDNPKANKKDVEEYMHWFYKEFKISENVTPKVVLLDSPTQLLQAIDLNNSGQLDITDLDDDQIAEALKGYPKDKKAPWIAPTYYLSAFNSWVSFYDFFDKEVLDLDVSELFNAYKRILDLNIFWSIPFENAVFVARNAEYFDRDEEFRLHSTDRYAIKFLDETGNYFIHGVCIEDQLFHAVVNEEYTFEDFSKEDNEEIKNAILNLIEERLGSEALYRFLSSNLEQIGDIYVDEKDPKYLQGTTNSTNIGVYTLFKGNVNDTDLAFVRCYCPSTDRMFFLGVDPVNTNAKDAIASLYRVPVKLKEHIKGIRRQGERFSTVFTDAGKALTKSMSKEDFEDLTGVTGDEYFSLMEYEY